MSNYLFFCLNVAQRTSYNKTSYNEPYVSLYDVLTKRKIINNVLVLKKTRRTERTQNIRSEKEKMYTCDE